MYIAECVHVEELLFLFLLKISFKKNGNLPRLLMSALDYFSVEIFIMAGTCF